MVNTSNRRLAAIMFTDIVGYSALTQRNESLALSLLAEHNAIIRGLLTVHHGREVKTVGDAFLVEFTSALDAVRCGIAIQEALAARNTIDAGESVHVRIGIHLGDVVDQNGDLFGDGVNIASRIQSIAEADGICVSEDVARQVSNKITQSLVDIGTRELKNISLPVQAYFVQLTGQTPGPVSPPTGAKTNAVSRTWPLATTILVLAGSIAGWLYFRALPTTVPALSAHMERAKSIAVLPFANLGSDREDDFFGDGLTEDLLTQLAQIGELKVISRTSVLQYKGTKKPMRDIARELGVVHVLEGSVRRSGTRFRINAQLIDAERDEHLWAKTYDRDIKDVLAVQSEVTTDIAGALKARILADVRSTLDRRSRGNSEAFLAYLKGMHELRPQMSVTLKEYDGAQAFFEEAMKLDPSSPLGAMGMANMYILKARQGLDVDANYAAAEKYALQALALDKALGEAYGILARVHGPGQYNWRQAEIDAKRAVELAPGASSTWDSYRVGFLEPTGRLDEALAAQQRAVSLDPRDKFLLFRLAQLHYWLGQCDKAIPQAETALKIFPDFLILHSVKVTCYEAEGKFNEATAANRLTQTLWADKKTLDEAERAISIQGDKGYSRIMLARQIERAKSRNDVWYYAAVYAGMSGEWDEAFRYLDKAIDARDRDPR